MIGPGAANGILTMIIFYLKSRKENCYMYSGADLQKELLISSIIIGITVTIISNFFTKRDLKKHKIETQKEKHIIQELIPSVKPYRAIYSTAFSFMVTYAITALILFLTQGINWYLNQSLIMIFLVSTLASALTAYMNIIKTAYEW